jgi:hypothetical protein
VLCISHAPVPLGNLGNGRWICRNIVTRHLKERRIVKPLRKVEERMLVAESTGLAKMAGVLIILGESSCMSVCPLLFYACEYMTFLCLGMPIRASSTLIGVFIVVGGMDQCAGLISTDTA